LKDAIIYEIALTSFYGSNGDGKGDLPGLLQRVEYLQWLALMRVQGLRLISTSLDEMGGKIESPSLLR
jgi:alpha-glucosidase